MIKFNDPNPAHRGYYGGCGDLDCPGQTSFMLGNNNATVFYFHLPNVPAGREPFC